MSISIHAVVPDFTAEATGSGSFDLSACAGKNVVLYFYPKDNTPGCTLEGENFRDLYTEFQNANTEIFGVSRDSIKSHEAFKTRKAFPFELISDTEEKICTLFDVMKMKNMYGKQVRGIERSTFLINHKGVLIQEWRGIKVPGHVQTVLDFVSKTQD